MPQQHNRYASLRRDSAIKLPEIIETLAPAIAFGKEAEIVSVPRGASVSAEIRGVDRIAFGRQRFRNTAIPSGMLGQAVDNLHRGFRLRGFWMHFGRPHFGKPAINRDCCSVLCGEGKSRFTHAAYFNKLQSSS